MKLLDFLLWRHVYFQSRDTVDVYRYIKKGILNFSHANILNNPSKEIGT